MDNETLNPAAQNNALILANAGEISARVIARIAGNEIANTLQYSPITKERIGMLVMGQMVSLIETQKK